METDGFQYQPGVCNIDSTGIRWRRRLGYICLMTGIASLGLMYWFGLGMIFRFVIGFGFGYMSSLNFIQAREHFCVMNSSKRTFEIGLHRMKIADDIYEAAGRKKMMSVIARSLGFALAGGCLGLLPL
ncbi:MAG: hypothetical protein ABI778_01920 [Ignavibacteriota bacterium]